MTARTLIVDFDGTACVGDAPALDYAAALDALVPHARLLDRVEGWIADPHGAAADDAVLRHADDIYQAAWAIAESLDLGDTAIHATYHASRARLTEGTISAERADGLVELSSAVREAGGRIVLVTNAPHDGLAEILDRLDMLHLFDDVRGDAGKPAGLGVIAAEYAGAAAGDRVASVGDIWRNDLAPIRELGGRTALIDRFGLGRGPADWSAPTLGALVPALAAWANET